jgi:polar amino acid transport system substrate-binding protein
MIAAAARRAARLLLAGTLLVATAGFAASAKEWTSVRIGTDATYPPFESVDASGAIVGWEIDYGRALCAAMRVTCTFQNQDWDGIVPALLAGKFDVISDAYYASQPVFIGQAGDAGNDVSPAARKGKSIGTQSSTIFADYLSTTYKESDIKLYPAGDEAMIELADGRLDYAVNDNVTADAFLRGSAGRCCRIVATIPRDPAIFGTGVGAAFRKEDTDLCRLFNAAIARLFADGTYARLAKRYFTVDVRPPGAP